MKKIDFVIILIGILFSPGCYMLGEYRLYRIHTGYEIHELWTIITTVGYLIGFGLYYGLTNATIYRAVVTAIVSTVAIFLTFTLYIGFFRFQA